jgi:recombination protein RecA
MSKSEDAMEAINRALAKKFKNKNVPELLRGSELPPVDWFGTGLLSYDWVNGGGAARRHVEQVYGRKSSGKTTTLLRRVAECQRSDLVCAYVDVEHTLEPIWAAKQGVNLDDLILYVPDVNASGEKTLETVLQLVISGEVDLIIVDSITAVCPEAFLSADLTDKHYGGNSSLITQFFDKLIGPGTLYNSNACLVLVNQPRDVIGSRFPMERLPGGRALQHYSSIITEIRQGKFITDPDDKTRKLGQEVKIINKKNKVRSPYRERTVDLMFGRGFNPLTEVLDFAEYYGLIEANGSWFYYNGERMGQGQNQQAAWLLEHRDVYSTLKAQIVEAIRSGK